jgi:hypothetical protein
VIGASIRSQNREEIKLESQSCVQIPLVANFGYGGEDIGKHLLEKIGSISMAKSSGTGL